MKMHVFAAALAAGVALAGEAGAAVVNYSADFDLNTAVVQTSPELVIQLPGGPIALNVGDTLEGTIWFANDGRITVSNGTIPVDREWITASFAPDLGTTAESVGTFRFLGVRGDYLLGNSITSNGVVGAIGFGKVANYTNSSFSFRGIQFSLTYVDDIDDQGATPFTTHVTPGYLSFPFEHAVITEGTDVPEPAAWALMLLGFIATGQELRRRTWAARSRGA